MSFARWASTVCYRKKSELEDWKAVALRKEPESLGKLEGRVVDKSERVQVVGTLELEWVCKQERVVCRVLVWVGKLAVVVCRRERVDGKEVAPGGKKELEEDRRALDKWLPELGKPVEGKLAASDTDVRRGRLRRAACFDLRVKREKLESEKGKTNYPFEFVKK